jgi:hypothetical protein
MSLMSIAAKAIVGVMLLTLIPIASSAATIDRLYCNGVVRVTTETPEYVWPRKAVLNGDHLRLWVERDVPRNTEETKKMVTFDENYGVGYQLDESGVAGVVPIGTPPPHDDAVVLKLKKGFPSSAHRPYDAVRSAGG